jgi:hypothetical protein
MDDLCDDISETLEKIECLITLVPYLDGSVDETRLPADRGLTRTVKILAYHDFV